MQNTILMGDLKIVANHVAIKSDGFLSRIKKMHVYDNGRVAQWLSTLCGIEGCSAHEAGDCRFDSCHGGCRLQS